MTGLKTKDGRGKRIQERPPGRPLSATEKKILKMLSVGLSIKEAGHKLNIIDVSVMKHIESICEKAFPTEARLREAICIKLLS